jgi:ABC-type uncharacterized transport system ATPase subunit
MNNAQMRVRLTKFNSQSIEAAERAGATDVKLEQGSLVLKSRAEDRLEILRAMEAAGGQIETFSTRELSLEDMYLNYVSNDGVHSN